MSKKKLSLLIMVAATVLNLALSLSLHATVVRANASCTNSPRDCEAVICSASCSGTCTCNGGRTTQSCWCNCSDGSSSWNSCEQGL